MKSVIIDRLIQIEDRARDITKDAEEQEKELPSIIRKEFAEIEEALKLDYDKKSKEMKAMKERECVLKTVEIEKEAAIRRRKLEAYFYGNHEAWETDIFNSIIGR